ncbi:MAG: 8-oxoguanine DNA glycosylase [Lachnospiraceae bacterium]|nr:8-oxoguanine DNA glycosylase [Lachnospiraceae bacterium]
MIEVTSKYFDPFEIMESGQCFRWHKNENGRLSVIALERYIEIEKSGDTIRFFCDKCDWDNIWHDYFDMSRDYGYIDKLISGTKDVHLKEAFKLGQGIRILKQDLWEMIVSFMISQNNNIPRIKGSIEAICERAGIEAICESHSIENVAVTKKYSFPGPLDVDISMFDDKSLGLGYRAPFLKDIFSFARENPEWLDSLKSMNYEQAKAALMERKGIGPKVANCICLFGLGHVEAFPIDTHVKQLLDKYYSAGFDFEAFDGVAGIIQQYLFYYELMNK